MVPLPTQVRDTQLIAEIQADVTVHFGSRVRQEWKRNGKIGEGASGIVYAELCVTEVASGQPTRRAVKQIRDISHKDYIRELEALAVFSRHRYEHCFVKSYGWYEADDSVYIAMEYLELGDLYHGIRSKGPLDQFQAASITSQIMEGLEFMHENHFAHRDLKPSNILVKSQPPHPWWVKIADFGISKRTYGLDRTTTVKGTFEFMAPEILLEGRGKTSNLPCDYFKADIWAVGCIAYFLLTQSVPFPDIRYIAQYWQGFALCPTSSLCEATLCDDGKDCLGNLLAVSPVSRPSATMSMSSRWLQRGRHPGNETRPTLLAHNALPLSKSGEFLDPAGGTPTTLTTPPQANESATASARWTTQMNICPLPIQVYESAHRLNEHFSHVKDDIDDHEPIMPTSKSGQLETVLTPAAISEPRPTSVRSLMSSRSMNENGAASSLAGLHESPVQEHTVQGQNSAPESSQAEPRKLKHKASEYWLSHSVQRISRPTKTKTKPSSGPEPPHGSRRNGKSYKRGETGEDSLPKQHGIHPDGENKQLYARISVSAGPHSKRLSIPVTSGNDLDFEFLGASHLSSQEPAHLKVHYDSDEVTLHRVDVVERALKSKTRRQPQDRVRVKQETPNGYSSTKVVETVEDNENIEPSAFSTTAVCDYAPAINRNTQKPASASANPQMLPAVEDAIKRLILPQLKELKGAKQAQAKAPHEKSCKPSERILSRLTPKDKRNCEWTKGDAPSVTGEPVSGRVKLGNGRNSHSSTRKPELWPDSCSQGRMHAPNHGGRTEPLGRVGLPPRLGGPLTVAALRHHDSMNGLPGDAGEQRRKKKPTTSRKAVRGSPVLKVVSGLGDVSEEHRLELPGEKPVTDGASPEKRCSGPEASSAPIHGAQREVFETEILSTLVRTADEMRKQWDDMKDKMKSQSAILEIGRVAANGSCEQIVVEH